MCVLTTSVLPGAKEENMCVLTTSVLPGANEENSGSCEDKSAPARNYPRKQVSYSKRCIENLTRCEACI